MSRSHIRKRVIPYLDEHGRGSPGDRGGQHGRQPRWKAVWLQHRLHRFPNIWSENTVSRMNGKRVLVIGNGGAMPQRCRRSSVTKAPHRWSSSTSLKVTVRSAMRNAYRSHLDAQVIINTSPVGMYPKTAIRPIDLVLCPCEAVMDVRLQPAVRPRSGCQKARKRAVARQRTGDAGSTSETGRRTLSWTSR